MPPGVGFHILLGYCLNIYTYNTSITLITLKQNSVNQFLIYKNLMPLYVPGVVARLTNVISEEVIDYSPLIINATEKHNSVVFTVALANESEGLNYLELYIGATLVYREKVRIIENTEPAVELDGYVVEDYVHVDYV